MLRASLLANAEILPQARQGATFSTESFNVGQWLAVVNLRERCEKATDGDVLAHGFSAG
ncbi:hypothetical protein [Pseudomonas sp. BIC9C]|uniref:hypothetical protein n=1 Tax=Pseudomonas sp. BIC9C TaxID=3078458 RepID=UPI002AD1F235|nr:hypothetical protein [Pseudomonas sp. BIC9C]